MSLSDMWQRPNDMSWRTFNTLLFGLSADSRFIQSLQDDSRGNGKKANVSCETFFKALERG